MDMNSLAHTRWECKYHIVFAPKFRRKVIYKQIRADVGHILSELCKRKGIEIIEAECMPDHVHMFVRIPPKYSVSSIMGYLKGKSSLMIFERHANLKYKYGNRHFWCSGYYVDTVGKNAKKIQEYIRNMERSKADIITAANSGAGIVKFIDRTFNCSRSRSFEIIEFIISNRGKLFSEDICFHFEVGADLFDEKTLNLLKQAPLGLFQFEAGIQSFNGQTLLSVCRKTDMKKLESNLRKIIGYENIHIHVDLIAGLPGETFDIFKESFNQAYLLYPHQLQLGFLKLLHRSKLRREYAEHDYIFDETAPYEIISGNSISNDDIRRLHGVEDALERIYNSGRFTHTLKYISKNSGLSPFEFYDSIAQYIEKNDTSKVTQSLDKYTKYLHDYICTLPNINRRVVRNLLVIDRIATDNTGYVPQFLRIKDQDYKRARLAAKNMLSAGQKIGVAIIYGENTKYGIAADYSVRNPVTKRYKIFRI